MGIDDILADISSRNELSLEFYGKWDSMNAEDSQNISKEFGIDSDVIRMAS